jgi:phosphoribosylaminoimidazole carboxylase (NCAIR synthetase)
VHIALLCPQADVIDELAGLGHTLTVLHNENNRRVADACAARIAHRGHVPAYDCPELAWSVLLHLGVADRVDVVIPCHEHAVVAAALLNRLLGLPERIDPHTAMAGRDKAYQKSLWARAGIPTARYRTVTDTPSSPRELAAVLDGMPGPYVVKPPSLGGSMLVSACPTARDVYETLAGEPELRHAVIEQRQPGAEWHLDGTVVDGRVTHLMVSKYLAPLIETKSGLTLRSVAHPPKRHPALYATAREFAQAAVAALGARWGVFHLEVFGEPGEFVAGECAWRPAGVLAYLSAQRTIGLNLWRAHARVLADEEVVAGEPDEDTVCGFVCLPVRPGAVNGVTRDDIEALPGVTFVKMVVEPGQMMGAMRASTTCVARALVEGDDVGDCARLIDEAVRRTDELHDLKSR